MNPPEHNVIESEEPGVLANLPRRTFLDSPDLTATQTQMRFLEFEFSRLQALGRFFKWISLLLSFMFSTFAGILIRKDSQELRAIRLRRAFEKRGCAFVKLGIHLSMRLDFLPWEYSVELSKMVDQSEPFPVEVAIQQIEETTSKPLGAIFARFDPEPVASTSTACIYQAYFHSNKRAIVKVRRPGVGASFMADLQAFDWLMMLADILTIFKPGLTARMRNEFRAYLLEELDFVNEARRQEIFRRSAAQSGRDFFSAPKAFLEYSGEAVVVEEFSAGIWLWELLAAVEHDEREVLEYARSIGISPKKVAKRLLWSHYWMLEENLFFRPDVHPNNIIIGQNSKLYFVDFALSGTLTRSKRQAMQQVLYYMKAQDTQNMARSSLVLMEPLPPVDLIELTQELEKYNLQLLYNLAATPGSLDWQERTSALLWSGIINVARKHNVVIDLKVLQLLRSALLCEASAVRLHHKIDLLKIYDQFQDHRAKMGSSRVAENLVRQLDGEQDERLIIRIDRITYLLQNIFFRARHLLTIPSVNFYTLAGKWSYAFSMLFRMVTSLIMLTGGSIAIYFALYLTGAAESLEPRTIMETIFLHPVFQVLAILLIFINTRAVLFRLEDWETKPGA